MATLQQIQEASRLKREKNLTPAQAVEQVRATATPITPPVTPTQNFPSQPLNQQTTTGVNGETFQVAPVTPQGVTPQAPTPSQPVQPTPTTTVQPTTTPEKVTPSPDVATIKAQNEAQMALNKQKSQLAIEERKQQEADAKMASIPTDQKSILTSLISGVSVPEQKTQAYRNAQFQYKNYQKFNAMTPQQLLKNMEMGEIDTATSQLLAGNPSYIKAKEDFDKFQKNQSINQMIRSVKNGATGKPETVDYAQEASDSLAKKLGIDQTNAEAYATIVSKNPEVVELTKTVSSLTKQLNTLNTERNAVYADLKSQYPDLSPSAIMTLMASRTKQATDQIDALNSSLTLASADLKTAMEMARGEYEATSRDIAMQSEIAKEDRTMQNSLALSQMQYDQKIAQQAQAMNDPTTAISTMVEEYKKLGIPFTRSTQQIIADFQTSGLDLPTYLSNLQSTIQTKPEYQKIQSLQMGQLSDAQKLKASQDFSTASDIRNFAQQKEIAKLNNDYNRQDFLFQLENDPAKRLAMAELEEKLNANKSLFDVLGKNVGTYEGNRGYDLAGKIGDPMPAGGNWKVKSVIDANYTSSPYGNSVVMEDENGNEVRYSHLQSIGVKPGDQLGFGDVVGTRGNTGNVKGANGETLTAEQLAKGRGAHLDVEIKSGGKLLSQDEQVDYLKSKKAGQVNSPLSTLGQFMKDNQDRGTGYSNDDVKAFNEKIDRLVKAGDTNGMALAYRNMVMKDKDFKKEFDDTTVFVQALDQVQSMINEYEAAGKSTNALKGMAEKVSRKLGITQDEALAKLQTQLGVTMANYIRSISGTAASDVEVQRLMGNMAQIGNVKNLNTAIVEQVRNNGLGGLKKMIDNRMYGMPEDLKPAVFGDIYTQTQNSSTPSSPNYNFQSDWENL